MLAPDFYVQLKDRRLTRQQFIDRISSYPPGVTLTPYDASVLTVEAKGRRSMRPGSPGMGWRKLSSDKWVILYSEEVGQERGKGASAAKLRCAPEWGACGRISVDGLGQHNQDRSEGHWGRRGNSSHGGAS
jgi:hypothetical protein